MRKEKGAQGGGVNRTNGCHNLYCGKVVGTPLDLKANQIDKITVITNPSSRYSSTANSIIKITTVKKAGDVFSLDNITTLGYRDYMYGKD